MNENNHSRLYNWKTEHLNHPDASQQEGNMLNCHESIATMQTKKL